jgi:hypothetical protein
MNDESSEEE